MNLLEQEPQPTDSSYRLITLTQGQFAIVDIEDFERIDKYNWYAKWYKSSGSFYAARNEYARGKQKTVLMHREIMRAPVGVEVDHRFHDTLDNRKGKLRLAGHTGNTQNARKRKDNTTGFKGVYPCGRKYRAQITSDGKQIYIGSFNSPEEAAIAYANKARELHGEFSCLG